MQVRDVFQICISYSLCLLHYGVNWENILSIYAGCLIFCRLLALIYTRLEHNANIVRKHLKVH